MTFPQKCAAVRLLQRANRALYPSDRYADLLDIAIQLASFALIIGLAWYFGGIPNE